MDGFWVGLSGWVGVGRRLGWARLFGIGFLGLYWGMVLFSGLMREREDVGSLFVIFFCLLTAHVRAVQALVFLLITFKAFRYYLQAG